MCSNSTFIPYSSLASTEDPHLNHVTSHPHANNTVINNKNNNKDSRWLTLEVCRDHLRGSCPKKEEDCMYAHISPSGNNFSDEFSSAGRVMCCYDFIKGKCYRKEPPCKFFHPPTHLREVLLFNGRQNLILKNLRLQHALNPDILFQSTPRHLNALLPVIYAPGHMNNVTSKMSDGPHIQQPIQQLANNPLSYWLVNQGGMTYFYPVLMTPENWVTYQTNCVTGCQAAPSPPLHSSIKQVDQGPPQPGLDEANLSPWLLQNGFSMAYPMCNSVCYGVQSSPAFVKRPPPYDVDKGQSL